MIVFIVWDTSKFFTGFSYLSKFKEDKLKTIFADIRECEVMDPYKIADYSNPDAPPVDDIIGSYTADIKWKGHEYQVVCYTFKTPDQARLYYERNTNGIHYESPLSMQSVHITELSGDLKRIHANRICYIHATADMTDFYSFCDWLFSQFSERYENHQIMKVDES